MQLSFFFDKISLLQKQSIILFFDNNGVINMTKIYHRYKRAKHVDVQYYFVKEKVKIDRSIYIPSEDNIADLLTKPLSSDIIRESIRDLGLWKPSKVREQRE